MELHFNEFENQSKEEWLGKIEKELKRSLNTVEIAHAYHHKSDPQTLQSSLALNNDGIPWIIQESFHADSLIENNETLLDALNAGTDGIHLSLVRDTHISNLEKIFNNVLADLVHIHLSMNLPTESLLNQIQNLKPKNGIIEHPEFNPSTITLIHKYLPNFRSIYLRTDDNKGLDGITAILLKAKEILTNFKSLHWSNMLADKFVFEISIGPDFKKEISKLRAFHLVWANMLAALGYDKSNNKDCVLAKIGQDLDPEDLHSNMIRLTTRSMSAAIGGASIISIAPSNGISEDNFTHRISRNIHHLLKMESFLDKVSDPSAGSYAIDQLTKNYCDSIWTSIK